MYNFKNIENKSTLADVVIPQINFLVNQKIEYGQSITSQYC